jgi:predicted porin
LLLRRGGPASAGDGVDKKILALAVTLAAAQAGAQGAAATTGAGSALTIFGIVDAGVTWGEGSVSDKTAVTSGNSSTSRLGFRGTEALGGGLYAGFWLESRLNIDDGTGGNSNGNNQDSGAGPATAGRQGLLFDRAAYVSLGGNWGELRLGRDFNATYRNRTDFDPFGNTGVGNSLANSMTIAGPTAVRASNMVNYLTPGNLGGFVGAFNYYLGENASGAANSDDGTGMSVRAGYAAGPWLAGVAYGITKYAQTASAGDVEVVNAGVSYAFPWAKLMGAVYRDRVEAATERTGKAWIVGAVVPVGLHEVKASVSSYEVDTAGNPKSTKVALGGVYAFSKRTAAYATYAHVKNSGGGAHAVGGAVTGANASSSGFDLGLRHSF